MIIGQESGELQRFRGARGWETDWSCSRSRTETTQRWLARPAAELGRVFGWAGNGGLEAQGYAALDPLQRAGARPITAPNSTRTCGSWGSCHRRCDEYSAGGRPSHLRL